MYLSKCIINGFKSFADKTEVVFHRGLAAVVGPNGCGKSNIYEAVLWVLGEQRPRNLRSSKMEDVIFAGSASRNAVGMAEVTVVIADPDRQLMDSEVVEITRRLFRSGQSEYLLNGQSCRLKDITKVLASSGIGRNTYAFIGQGKVEQILQSRPQDLRLLFEDAAGISQYKEQKFATEAQLHKNAEGIERLNDLVTELTSDIANLQKRAEKAHLHQELSAERLTQFRTLLINDFRVSIEKIKKVNRQIDICKQDLEDNEIKLIHLKSEFAILEAELYELQSKQVETEKELIKCEGVVENFNSRLEEISISIADRQQVLQKRKNEWSEVESREQTVVADISKSERSLQEYSLKIATTSDALEQVIKRLSELDHLLKPFNLPYLESENSKLQEELGSLREKISSNEARKASLTTSIRDFEKELANLAVQVDTDQEQHQQITDNLAKIKEELTEQQSMGNRLANQITEIEQKSKAYAQQQVEVGNKLRNNRSQLSLYQKLSSEYTGYFSGVKAVMLQKQKQPQIYADIIGVITELITVPTDYQTAISAALGGQAQYIVAQNGKSATVAIKMLRDSRAGKATFLPLDRISPSLRSIPSHFTTDDAYLGRAIDLVTVNPAASKAIKYLLNNVVVVRDQQAALRLTQHKHPGLVVVTLTGEVFSPGGSISGGKQKNNYNEELLSRQQKLQELEAENIVLEELSDQVEAQVAEHAVLATEFHQKAQNKRLEITELYNQILKLEKTEYFLSTNIDRKQKNYEEQENRLTHSRVECQRISKELIANYAQVKRVQERLNDIVRELQQSRAYNTERIALQQQRTVLEADQRLFENNIQSLVINIASGKRSEKQLVEQRLRLEAELEVQTASFATLLKQQNQYQTTLNRALEDSHALGTAVQRYSNLVELKIGEQAQNRRDTDDLTEQSERLKNRQLRLEKNQIEQQTSHKYVEAELYKAQISRKECSDPAVPDVDLRSLRQSLKKLDQAIASLGNVDYGSIADLERRLERIEFLKNQQTDLEETAERLRSIISDFDNQCYAKLETTINIVNKNFSLIFYDLFQGGNAEINWEFDGDLFNSGITLNVCPPGKKVQNMAQLSGGEKSLTAIALLLAFARLKPSSFCIFDEVDAALDEVNNIRLAEFWHQISANTQIIAITHSRHTMVKADYLFGVVMQEKGISKVVSVAMDTKNKH